MTRYLLDANIFIQAKNLHYDSDFRPAFRAWLDLRNAEGVVASIDKVGDELAAGQDELASWARARGRAFFLPPDPAMTPAELLSYSHFQHRINELVSWIQV